MRALVRRLVDANVRLGRRLDLMFPPSYRTSGMGHFCAETVPALVRPGMVVYDLGAGKRPSISAYERTAQGLSVIGVDISAEELASAPAGSYDDTMVADLADFAGNADGDLVICRATLEHVRDAAGAMRGIASATKFGGKAAIFAPCRKAPFAWLNRFLSESTKQRILFALFPHKAGDGGFEAFYDRCTPSEMESLARAHGLEVIERRVFWHSSYFMAFLPAYLTWRFWTVFARRLLGDDYCETFVLVFERRDGPALPRASQSGTAAIARPLTVGAARRWASSASTGALGKR